MAHRLTRRLGAIAEIIGALAGLIVVSALIGALIVPVVPNEFAMPIRALGLWGGVATAGFFLRRTSSSYREIGLRGPASWKAAVGWALVGLIVSFTGTIAIGALIRMTTDWPPLNADYIRHSIEGNPVVYFVWIAVVVWGTAAFGEELLLRDFVLDRARIICGFDRAGTIVAVFLQAAAFGALHAIQGPTGIVITGYVGVVLACIYFASGRNLWAPILAHGMMDTISLTMMFLGIQLPSYIR